MLYLIYILIFASVTFLVLGLYQQRLARKPLPVLKLHEEPLAHHFKRPPIFVFLSFLMPLNKFIVNRWGRINIEDKLLAANVGLLPEDFITLKEVLLGLSILFLFLFKELFVGGKIIWMAIFIGASLMGPDSWLKMRKGRRQRMIIKALPDVTDLLSLCVNAGLDFSVAVKWVVEKSKPSPLIEELGLFLFETKVGKSRKQGLQDMARRINLPEVGAFCRALIQAERLGTPVETALAILSEEVREYRFRRGERRALVAPIKLLFPLIFFIMPVVGIIVGGPVILQFTQGSMQSFKF